MSDRERSRSRTRNGSRDPPPKQSVMSRGHSRSRSRTPPPPKSSSRKYRSPSPGGRSRSRSGSLRRAAYRGSRYSRSRSRSYSPRGSYRRSHSHSPMSSRKRHMGDRKAGVPENPTPSRCLGVFGLSLYTTEQQINHIFSKYGPVEKTQVVIDAKTGRSRGFCFVYFENQEDAKVAKNECTGMEIDGRRIRVDFSITQRAHTPTPGIYMGKPTSRSRDNGYDRRGGGRDRDDYYYRGGGYRDRERDYYHRSYRHRSPSPHYRRSRRYERERSYSPRRY
ncbi:RNA recognition motif domain-containing protein [Phthorimaea operculella]|nr:RNA recognition motif domain-containing protein [Phthorimaea operculella]